MDECIVSTVRNPANYGCKIDAFALLVAPPPQNPTMPGSPSHSDALNFAKEAIALQKASVERRKRDLMDSHAEISRITGLRDAIHDLYPRETNLTSPPPPPSDIDIALYPIAAGDGADSRDRPTASDFRGSESSDPAQESLSYAYVLEFIDSLLMEREHIILTPSSSQTVLSPATKLLLNPDSIDTLPIATSPLLRRISTLDTNAILDLREGVEQRLLRTVSDENRRALSPSLTPVRALPSAASCTISPTSVIASSKEGSTPEVISTLEETSLLPSDSSLHGSNAGDALEPSRTSSVWRKTAPVSVSSQLPLDFSLEDTEPLRQINASMRRMIRMEKNLQEVCSQLTPADTL